MLWLIADTHRRLGDSDFELGRQREQSFDEGRLADVTPADETHLETNRRRPHGVI